MGATTKGIRRVSAIRKKFANNVSNLMILSSVKCLRVIVTIYIC